MQNQIKLDNEKFTLFMQVISLISKSCNDLTIKNGSIRQSTNTRSAIFNIDLSAEDSLGLSDVSFSISGIQQKEKLLSILCKQASDLDISIDESDITFADEFTTIKTIQPLEKFLTNPYISEEELDAKLNLDPLGQFLNCELDDHIIERLNVMSDALSASILRIDLLGDKAIFTMRSSDNIATTNVELITIEAEDLLPENKYCSYPIEPFQMHSNHFDLQFWFNKDHTKSLLKLSTEIGSEERKVPIIIWGTAHLRDIE